MEAEKQIAARPKVPKCLRDREVQNLQWVTFGRSIDHWEFEMITNGM